MLDIGSRSYHISEKSMILLLICNWLLYILIHLTFVFHVKVIHKGLISKKKAYCSLILAMRICRLFTLSGMMLIHIDLFPVKSISTC